MKTKEREAKERTKEREEKENSSSSSSRARAMVRTRQTWLPTSNHEWPFTVGDVYNAASAMGMPVEEANDWMDYMDQLGWRFKDNTFVTVRNFRRSLRMWHIIEPSKRWREGRGGRRDEKQTAAERGEKRNREAKAAQRASAAQSEKAWELCAERCSCFTPSADGKPFKCSCCFALPPNLRDVPCPPEECPGFKPLEA